MNPISRFCMCRRNPFTRWSSKPISSSPLIPNKPASANLITLVSKFHHTSNYPPAKIFLTTGNHFRTFSGEPAAAAECEFNDDYLEKEIFEVYEAGMDAQTNIELGSLPPLDAVNIPADKFNALMEKLAGKNGGLRPIWCEFRRWYRAGGDCEGETSESENEINSDDDYLAKEFNEVYDALLAAHDHIELGTLPPLDAAKIMVDKFKAIMEIVGLDYEDNGDYPPHQHMMRLRVRSLQDTVQETMAFAKYVAAGKNSGPPSWDKFIDYDAVGEFKFWEESFESKNESDTLPSAKDQIAMRVGDASAVVAENLAAK
ncbi:hypothetical protein MKW92_042120 [Papaver armeniacum]|nr:hypothetical protein MKW92_042120 [Papaver armeniacum]